MATNVYVTAQGQYYAASSPTNASDSLLSFPSADLLASLTSTPVAIPTADAAAEQLVDESGINNGGDA